MAAMSRAGVRRAIGIVASAQRSYSGCLQYREDVRDARIALASGGVADLSVTYAGDWHRHPGFIAAQVDRVRAAFDRLPLNARADARLVFTAHSIPQSMADEYPYERQLVESATLVLDALSNPSAPSIGCHPEPSSTPSGRQTPAIVYQSRSGRPGDPWLEPDICDYLRAEHARGLRALVVCPIGFLCDHVEVLYDLDVEAAETARELGIALARAESVNAHPHFIDALADAVFDVWARYRNGRVLPIVGGRP
jgi:ferrochelatase